MPKNNEPPSKLCDRIRKLDKRIRHVGYYDGFGRILYDSIKENQVPMEGAEDMHILNGTIASTLNLWRPANSILGKVESFIMIRERIVGVIVPHGNQNYFLVIFESRTPINAAERIRAKLLRSIALV